jgi:hypothetical protein
MVARYWASLGESGQFPTGVKEALAMFAALEGTEKRLRDRAGVAGKKERI